MTLEATQRQADKINKYWEERGFKPAARAEKITVSKMGSYSVIRSDLVMHVPKLVNGRPMFRGHGDLSDIKRSPK